MSVLKINNMKRIKLNIISVLSLFLISSTSMSQNTIQTLEPSTTISPLSLEVKFSPLSTNIGSDKFGSEEKRGFGFNAGTNLVYEFYRKEKLGLNVSLGLGVSSYSNTRKANISNSLWTTDADNESVLLTENATDLNENQHFLFLDIPLKLGADYLLLSKLEAYATIGLSYGFNLKSTYDATAVLTRTGYYPASNVLLYDVNLVGSPYFYPEKLNVSGAGRINRKNNVAAETSLGLKYALSPIIKLFGGITYTRGFENVKTNGEIWILASDAVSLNSLSNRNDALKTSGFGMEVGVVVNLIKKSKRREIIQHAESLTESKPLTTMVNVETKPDKNVIDSENTVQKKDLKESSIQIDSLDSKIKASESEPKIQGILLNVKVMRGTEDSLSKAAVFVKEKGQLITQTTPDKDGYIQVIVQEGKIYDLEVYLKGYLPQYQTVDLTNVAKGTKQEVSMPPVKKIGKGIEFKYTPINFENGKDLLTTLSLKILDDLVLIFKDYPRLKISISGHTDNVGNPAFNLLLSKKRALAVKNYLLKKGLLSGQIITFGFGQTIPITSNVTMEGRAENRRVEFKIIRL